MGSGRRVKALNGFSGVLALEKTAGSGSSIFRLSKALSSSSSIDS